MRQEEQGGALDGEDDHQHGQLPDALGHRRPHDAAAAVAQREHPHRGGRSRGVEARDVDRCRRHHRDQRDARRDRDGQRAREQVPLRGAQRLRDGKVGSPALVERDPRARRRFDPMLVEPDPRAKRRVRVETLGRRTQQRGAEQAEDQVAGAQREEGRRRLRRGEGHEPLRDGRRHRRAEPEAAHREAGHDGAVPREPLLQQRDGNDVGHAEAEPADDAVPEDEQPQVRRLAGERREHHARAVDGAADERHQARAAPVLQPPADRRADEDQPDGELERHRRLDVPQPHRLGRLERAPEEAPRIDPADDELDKDSAHEGQPTHGR